MKTVLKVIAVAGLVAGLIVGAPAAAMADTPSRALPAKQSTIEWGRTTSVTWDGQTRVVMGGAVQDTVVVVPGDRVEHSAIVRNDGPAAARVSVQIVDIRASHEDPVAHTDFENLIRIVWDFNGFKGEQPWVKQLDKEDETLVSYTATFDVPQGGEFPIMAGFYFPIEATKGMGDLDTPSTLTFDVRVTMVEDTGSSLVATGGSIAPHTGAWIAGTLLAVGAFGLFAARLSRRRASVAQR
ncbi:MAG: hypothetical protein FWD75_05755 [Propionibacteriaceae bacterium]|nr:hypothetical protein [Propionibacteriaceae bacterium]